MSPVQSRSSSTSNIFGGTPTPHSLATNRRRERCMGKYAIRRVLLFIPTLLLATVMVFALFWIVPGDPALTILGRRRRQCHGVAGTALAISPPLVRCAARLCVVCTFAGGCRPRGPVCCRL